MVKTFLLLSDNWETSNFSPLFDSLKENLNKLSVLRESALKHKKNIAKTLNNLQTNGNLSNEAFLEDYSIQRLNIDSSKIFKILSEHESLSQHFILNSHKLFKMLINYDKNLQKRSPKNFEK